MSWWLHLLVVGRTVERGYRSEVTNEITSNVSRLPTHIGLEARGWESDREGWLYLPYVVCESPVGTGAATAARLSSAATDAADAKLSTPISPAGI